MAGRETVWAEQRCPRCTFRASGESVFDLFAVWDGDAWTRSDAPVRFREYWVQQEQASGLITEDPPEYWPIATASGGLDPFSTLWCFRALHPGVTHDEATLLIASTSIARRPGYDPKDLEPLPYSDISVLRELSLGVTSRWLAYHEALWSVLSEDDRSRSRSTTWEHFHELSEYRREGQGQGTQVVTVYHGWLAGFAERLLDAHRHVTEHLGVAAPKQNDRWQCHGNAYGEPAKDIALCLSDWANGRPAWMELASKPG